MSLLRRAEEWNLDLDSYINRVVPPSPLHKLPAPLSRYLGYRKEQKPDVGNVLGAFWSCAGAFCGLAVIAAVFNNSESIQERHPPALIASFGASAILEYNVIRSPLGQPRNAFLGHTFSALVGVSITKLFLFHPNFQQLRWIAGAVSCGIASAIMLLTGTVHPPGGASAVLAATSPEITEMGWYFVGLVMLGTTLMLIVGLLVNNVQRQFPTYWWTPLDIKKTTRNQGEVEADGCGGFEFKGDENEEQGEIRISALRITLPMHLALNTQEAELLEKLKMRLGRTDPDICQDEELARPSIQTTIVQSLHEARSDSDTSASIRRTI